MKAYKSILIVKMSSLGDVLHALPTLHALRQNCPDAHIVWAVHQNFAAVLPGKPYIDDVVYIDKSKLTSITYWRELWHTLHAYHFDVCFDLQGLAKSAIVALLSGAKEKYGYWEMREGSFLVSKGLTGIHKNDHVIERYLDTVRVLGGTVSSVEFPLPNIDMEKQIMRKRFTEAGMIGPYIAVVPGARWKVKEWPLRYWSDFVNRVAAAGMNVILLGSGEDIVKGQAIMAGTKFPNVFDYTGKTSLHELMAAISMASVYISADTGPLHIANALKKELIALFGPTCPDRTGPYGGETDTYIHIILSSTSKATQQHPLINDPDCMAQISVLDVWDTYTAVIKKVKA